MNKLIALLRDQEPKPSSAERKLKLEALYNRAEEKSEVKCDKVCEKVCEDKPKLDEKEKQTEPLCNSLPDLNTYLEKNAYFHGKGIAYGNNDFIKFEILKNTQFIVVDQYPHLARWMRVMHKIKQKK